jgi:hypothetical protein
MALAALPLAPAWLPAAAALAPGIVLLGFASGLTLIDLARRRLWRRDLARSRDLAESAVSGHYTAVETALADVLAGIDWVLETSATFEASPDGRHVSVDVNLPEIEDLESFARAARSAGQGPGQAPERRWEVEREYQLHVHAVLLRMAGEIFYHFPTVRQVAASGWTDRADPATGLDRGEYVISAVFDRDRWLAIDPAAADPVECVGLFPVRRDIAEDSRMAAVTPFRLD